MPQSSASVPQRPAVAGPRPHALGRVLGGVAAGAAVAVLAATFAAYLSPGLALDLGQLMLLCGFR